MLITFSSTFVFQAGLIGILVRKFAGSLLAGFGYFVLSITLHVLSLVRMFVYGQYMTRFLQRDRWDAKTLEWPIELTIIYVIQRMGMFI